MIVGVSLIIVRSIAYNIKCLEATVLVTFDYINKIQLNTDEGSFSCDLDKFFEFSQRDQQI